MQNQPKETVKNAANSISSSVKNSMNGSALNSAKSSVEDAAYSLSDVASDIAHQGYDMVADRARTATNFAEKTYEGGVDYVKRNPGRSLIGAAVIGFLAAGFLRRSRK